jgi:hypothetical protein
VEAKLFCWWLAQELTKFKGKAAAFKDPAAAIATATRSAFTRECNKDTRPVRDASMQIKGMKKSKSRNKVGRSFTGLYINHAFASQLNRFTQ